jgi:hypothetical protein
MREDFLKIKRQEELKGMNIENMWKRFCMLMDLEVEKCVPAVKVSGRHCPKWMNRAAKVGRRKKVNKWKQCRESGSFNNLVEYKLARKLADREYRKAK